MTYQSQGNNGLDFHTPKSPLSRPRPRFSDNWPQKNCKQKPSTSKIFRVLIHSLDNVKLIHRQTKNQIKHLSWSDIAFSSLRNSKKSQKWSQHSIQTPSSISSQLRDFLITQRVRQKTSLKLNSLLNYSLVESRTVQKQNHYQFCRKNSFL